jgi:hypothetical protein
VAVGINAHPSKRHRNVSNHRSNNRLRNNSRLHSSREAEEVVAVDSNHPIKISEDAETNRHRRKCRRNNFRRSGSNRLHRRRSNRLHPRCL